MNKKKSGLILPTSGNITARNDGEVSYVHDGESINCNLCGRKDEKELYKAKNYGIKFRIVRCKNCGLAYINPRMSSEIIENMYSTRDTIKLGFAVSACGTLAKNQLWHEARFRKMEMHHLEMNPSFKPDESLKFLDMGCGLGQTLEFAEKRGWEPHGIDISDWAVEEGKRLGRNILLTNLEDSPFEDGYFDIILMSEVIEHVTDPMHELKVARQKLKNGGIIVIDTINIDSFFMRFLGERSSFIEAGHLTYFSYRSLREMLQKSGYRVLKGYRGLEIDLDDYLDIYRNIFKSKTVFLMELGLTVFRKIGIGDFCFGGISYYAVK